MPEQDNVTGVSEAAKPDQPRLAPHRRTRGSLFKTRACLCNRLHLMICLVPHIAGSMIKLVTQSMDPSKVVIRQ
ncbi:hypothetical protein E2C01_002701 [Portunus trituberculatus]|uniref:Uncharacterized protein n=1 Tax=Portunus trituberculatus TaxID=210409 RepID=A0A5B7CRG1_PORTR|nr:hypothetical protein [Portunus trituberculatus]